MATSLPPARATRALEAWSALPLEGREAVGVSRVYGEAVMAVVLCTLVDSLWVHHTGDANLILVYFLGLLPVALRGRRGPAIAAAALAVICYDFFFVPPVHSFAVADTQYLFTLLVMGLVGLVISTLTARLATELSRARQRERGASALYELGQSLLAAREPTELFSTGTRVIGRELGQVVAAWRPGATGEPEAVIELEPPLTPAEREMVRGALLDGAASGPGTQRLPGASLLLWPVRTAERVHGVLGARARHGEPPGLELRGALATGASQLAVALDQARAREEAAVERLRSDLLGAVSHDLRTPLAGIVGAATSLVSGAEALTSETRRDLAQGIVEEADRLNRLVTNLLYATRLQGGHPQLSRSWCDLDELVAGARERLGLPLATHPLAIAIPPELPPLEADPVLLEQVFINLLDNACKYTPPGTPIELTAWQAGGRVVVEVADHGPGLPPGAREHLFEKFHRFGQMASGTGLGLAVCRGVVLAHGGTIEGDNRPQGGAVFRLSLPLASAPEPPPGKDPRWPTPSP